MFIVIQTTAFEDSNKRENYVAPDLTSFLYNHYF